MTAVIGTAYHGFFTGGRWGGLTWAVMSSMVVVVMSFLLAASVSRSSAGAARPSSGRCG